jgi:hypothetical protein
LLSREFLWIRLTGNKKAYLGVPGVDLRIILKLILKKQGVRVSSEFNWFRIGFNGGILYKKGRN